METNHHYVLKYICGNPRLLPCGQTNANLCGDIILNSTGAYIWSHITPGMTKEELVELFCRDYDCVSDEDRADATKMIDEFTYLLVRRGLLYHPYANPRKENLSAMEIPALQDAPSGMVGISDFNIAIYGDSDIIPSEFEQFIPTDGHVIQKWYLHPLTRELPQSEFRRVCVSEEVGIYEQDNYLIFFDELSHVKQAQMDQSGENVHLFYEEADKNLLQDDLFRLLGNIFFYRIQQFKHFALHSSSIIYRGKAWLFSAQTGIGKTTHTNLWHDVPDVKFFNGDINLIKENENGDYIITGLPWCGTSGVVSTGEYPLGGIIFIKRGEKDHTEDITDEEKITTLLHRLISPMWKPNMVDLNLNFATKVSQKVLVCDLFCTMNKTAMEVMKAKIDSYLSGK